MKNFWESLRQHAMKIINFKKEKKKLLTKEQQKSFENLIICNICKEKTENKYLKDILKLETIVIIQRNIEVLRI